MSADTATRGECCVAQTLTICSFTRKEVWQRHEALHLEPVSSNPRVRPVTVGALGRASNAVPHSTLAQGSVPLKPPGDGNGAPHGSRRSPSPVSRIIEPTSAQQPSASLPNAAATSNPTNQLEYPPLLGTSSVHQTTADTSLDYRSTGQSAELLFDAEVYGWLSQILGEQLDPAVNRTQTSYFPPAVSSISLEGPSYPQLPADEQTRLPSMVQGMAASIGAPSPQCDASDLAAYFASGWRLVSTNYPVVHEPTFDINAAPPVFLLSIISCGAASSSVERDRACAKQLQPIIRAMAAAVSANSEACV